MKGYHLHFSNILEFGDMHGYSTATISELLLRREIALLKATGVALCRHRVRTRIFHLQLEWLYFFHGKAQKDNIRAVSLFSSSSNRVQKVILMFPSKFFQNCKEFVGILIFLNFSSLKLTLFPTKEPF